MPAQLSEGTQPHPAPVRRRVLWTVAVALPPLVLAGAGLSHPMDITPATAHHWREIHIWLLPVFPLLAAVITVLLRGESGVVAWAARIAAYGYAVYYTGLDTLAGIAAGTAMDTDPNDPAIMPLLLIGNQLADPGNWCYGITVLLTASVLIRRLGRAAVPGAVLLVVAAIPFILDHIYRPWGVLGMLGTAVAAAWVELARPAPAHQPEPSAPRGGTGPAGDR